MALTCAELESPFTLVEDAPKEWREQALVEVGCAIWEEGSIRIRLKNAIESGKFGAIWAGLLAESKDRDLVLTALKDQLVASLEVDERRLKAAKKLGSNA